MFLLVWLFQSNSSDISGELNPIEVPACAKGQTLPRYEVLHAWFLIVYMLSLLLVDFVPLCFPSLSLPAERHAQIKVLLPMMYFLLAGLP